MIDIVSAEQGKDLGMYSTQTTKAGNILSVQIGALEYAPDLGINLAYFLSEDFQFQNESFKSYLIQILANNGINVANVTETINALFSELSFNLSAEETGTELIAR